MLAKPDVNSDPLMDMMEFRIKPFTIGLEHGLIIVIFERAIVSVQPHVDLDISIR
jgi:hypothetical protein